MNPPEYHGYIFQSSHDKNGLEPLLYLCAVKPAQDYINASLSMIPFFPNRIQWNDYEKENDYICLLYTSDAADE